MIDHGRHSRGATPFDVLSRSDAIRHRACGGRMVREWSWWECRGCGAKWSGQRVDNWGTDEIAARFYLFAPEPDAVTLVWVTDGKHRFTRAVPSSEAHRYPEKFQ